MDRFIAGQRRNLDQLRQTQLFQDLIDSLDRAYRSVIEMVPELGPPIIYGRFVLVCHKSMLSAATLIGQGQPEDAGGVTRRAVEAARVALAIKLNDENAAQWVAYEDRHDRWLRRLQNERPRSFRVEFRDIRGHAVIERLDTHLGTLSDGVVHFTPEFYIGLDWEVREAAGSAAEIYLNYFQRDNRAIELALISLSAMHLTILEAFDACYDSRLQADGDCQQALVDFIQLGKASIAAYQQRYRTAE
jgi:hypothetical protein